MQKYEQGRREEISASVQPHIPRNGERSYQSRSEPMREFNSDGVFRNER